MIDQLNLTCRYVGSKFHTNILFQQVPSYRSSYVNGFIFGNGVRFHLLKLSKMMTDKTLYSVVKNSS